MASSEQLEREAEATRARIAATLTELRARISPGQMLDEAIDYARDGNGADLLRAVRQGSIPPTKVCVITGCGSTMLREVESLGPEQIFPKPLNVDRLLSAMQAGLGVEDDRVAAV